MHIHSLKHLPSFFLCKPNSIARNFEELDVVRSMLSTKHQFSLPSSSTILVFFQCILEGETTPPSLWSCRAKDKQRNRG